MKASAVLFDLDGTLLDTEGFIVWTFLEASKAFGVSVDPRVISRNVGRPIEELVAAAFAGVEPTLVAKILEARRGLVEREWKKMVKPFPDAAPALSRLRRSGLKMGVATSSRPERALAFLDYFGLRGFFDVVVGLEEGLRGKPSPDILLEAIARLGASPASSVYVGDREVDCLASRSAGVGFILVNRGGYDYDFSLCTPDAAVRSLLELPGLLGLPPSV